MFQPMSWPYSIPAGLRNRINRVLGVRNHGAPEIWGEVRDWLVEHGVEKPLASRLRSRRREVRSGTSST